MSKKKLKEVAPYVVREQPYTAEEQESRYNKNYGFNKQLSARSPVTGWEDKYIKEGVDTSTPPKEISLVKGTPHRFGGVRSGNSYGKRQAMKRIK